MIRFFYEAAGNLKRKGKPYWSLVYKLGKLLLNLLYPISQRFRRAAGTDENGRIIVSLTSFPDRIGTVWITIASLFNQTRRPYRVILWLAGEQFPDRSIPKSLSRLRKRGLEIRFCEDDLKPHKKYFYAVQEYPEYFVVTADDDVLYPENFLEELWKGCEKYPGAVVCSWSHQIGFSGQGEFEPYNSWGDEPAPMPQYRTLAVGCNGILYPPGSIPKDALDKEKIRENALYTDDLWLKCMEIRNGRKAVNCRDSVLIYFNQLAAGGSGLWKRNTGPEQNNDRVWERLMRLYPEVRDALAEEVASEKEG